MEIDIDGQSHEAPLTVSFYSLNRLSRKNKSTLLFRKSARVCVDDDDAEGETETRRD